MIRVLTCQLRPHDSTSPISGLVPALGLPVGTTLHLMLG